MELGIPRLTVGQILKQKFHSYKLQILHHLTEDDPNRCIEMCEWFSAKLNENIRFIENCVLFNDEALFYVNGEVNRQNVRYWLQQNPHFVDYFKQQEVHKVMVCCGLWKSHVLGPFFLRIT